MVLSLPTARKRGEPYVQNTVGNGGKTVRPAGGEKKDLSRGKKEGAHQISLFKTAVKKDPKPLT